MIFEKAQKQCFFTLSHHSQDIDKKCHHINATLTDLDNTEEGEQERIIPT